MFYTMCRFLSKIYVILYFNISFEGLDNIPKDKGFILVSNHRTYFDPIFIGVKLKQKLTFMAKKELIEKGFLSFFIKRLGIIPISKQTGGNSAIEKAIEVVKENKVLALFPEGTRSKDGRLGKIKSGAVLIASKTNADIVPVAICYDGKLKFRKNIVVRYGKAIKSEQLNLEEPTPDNLKQARKLLEQVLLELLGD